MMGVYPPGSIVQLVDDRFGMVVSVNSSRPLKPRVIVHEPGVPRDEALILDLEHAPRVGIRRSLKPSMLPAASLDFLAPRQRMCYYFEKLVDPQMQEVKVMTIQRHASVLDGVLEAVWWVHPVSLRMVWVNKAATQLMGVSAPELVGTPAVRLDAHARRYVLLGRCCGGLGLQYSLRHLAALCRWLSHSGRAQGQPCRTRRR